MDDCTAAIIGTVSQCVSAAVKDLPLSPVDVAFNGADWVWLWRDRSEAQNLFAETSIHVRPDPHAREGFELQILASAWNPEQPGASAGRLYYARYFESAPRVSERQDLISELKNHIEAAHSGALALARELSGIQTARSEAYEVLLSRVRSNNEEPDLQHRFE
jgi:hypothetical protein